MDGSLERYSGTWPRSGIVLSGIAYLLQPLVRLTDETGCGLLPTPNAQEPVDNKKIDHYLKTGEIRKSFTGYKHPRRLMLAETVIAEEKKKMWATPTTHEVEHPETSLTKSGRREKIGKQVGLDSQVLIEQYRNEGKTGGQLNPTWVEWLMGWPLEWTVLDSAATAWSRSKPSRRSKKS